MEKVKYTPSLKITNTDQLPRGLNAKYLLALKGPNGSFIAMSWKRIIPKESMSEIHVLIVMK